MVSVSVVVVVVIPLFVPAVLKMKLVSGVSRGWARTVEVRVNADVVIEVRVVIGVSPASPL
jgi:hypothetical protein